MPDGSTIPMYAYDEISQGVSDLPTRYGVVLDFALAKQSENGYVRFRVLKRDPLTGSVEEPPAPRLRAIGAVPVLRGSLIVQPNRLLRAKAVQQRALC